MAESVRKEEEITTSDLVRDARKQPESVERERAPEAMREFGRRQAEDKENVTQNMPLEPRVWSREVSRATGPQPVPATIDGRPSDRPNGNAHVEADGAAYGVPRPEKASEQHDQPAETAAMQGDAPLFTETQTTEFRSRWVGIQTGFVDEPRKTVAEADKLVALLMTQLAEGFASERTRLEKQWDGGNDVSTEDLRMALKRYRSFFDRLLKV